MSLRSKNVGHNGMHVALVALIGLQITIEVVAVGATVVVVVDDLETVGRGALEMLVVADAGWPGFVGRANTVVKPPSNSSTAAAVMICVFVA